MNNLVTQVDNAVTGAAGQFVSTLSQYKWDLLPDSQLHAAKQALTKNDYIMNVAANNPESVHESLIQAAILGLDLTEGKRQGWLLPRKSQKKDAKGNAITNIQLQVGYKGVEAIHQRMGVIDRLVIRVVRKNDSFEWSGDDQEKPKHEADWFADNETRGEISGAFAITYLPDGNIHVVVAPITDIFEKHRDRSESYKSYKAKTDKKQWAHEPPWVSDEKSMVEKTMAYIAAKQWPANIRDSEQSSKILQTLHETDIADYNYQYTTQQKEAFYSFIENDDPLGMFLFEKRVDMEVYTSLHRGMIGAIPRGGKTQRRKEHADFVSTGENVFFDILKSLDSKDAGQLSENVEGCSEITMKLLNAALNKDQQREFEELMK